MQIGEAKGGIGKHFRPRDMISGRCVDVDDLRQVRFASGKGYPGSIPGGARRRRETIRVRVRRRVRSRRRLPGVGPAPGPWESKMYLLARRSPGRPVRGVHARALSVLDVHHLDQEVVDEL